jgi:predicted nucleic acid-binding protein
MTGERALSFVDTNVLLYAFDKSSSPKKRVAQLELAQRRGLPLTTLDTELSLFPS